METIKTDNKLYTINLSGFKTIDLKEMNKAALMNRTDNKFLLNQAKLSAILEELTKSYYVLEINGILYHRYTSIYFDTYNFDMYLNHHNRRLNRYRVRQRKYNTTGESFLEIKKKTNKGETLKKRVKIDSLSQIIPYKKIDFVAENLPYHLFRLHASLTSEFYRLTLTNSARNQRITIDSHIELNNGLYCKYLYRLVIVEVKSEKHNPDKTIFNVLQKHRIHSNSMSKYSIGMAMLHPDLKQNLFKEKIHLINKI